MILATTVEWFGIGGYMQQFLDACWLYGNKEKIQSLYMQPIVMSTTYGEKEAMLTLINAWEVLGGQACEGICGYVENVLDFEMNKEYLKIIEKRAENLYRTISQKIISLPSSNRAVQQSVRKTHHLELTPKESEQLSKYVANDTYINKQKEDIEELSNLFKGMMQEQGIESASSKLDQLFVDCFIPQEDFKATYELNIDEQPEPLHLNIKNQKIDCYYGRTEPADVTIKIPINIINHIISGRMTFQRAFMTGEIVSRGGFKILRMLDQIFSFENKEVL